MDPIDIFGIAIGKKNVRIDRSTMQLFKSLAVEHIVRAEIKKITLRESRSDIVKLIRPYINLRLECDGMSNVIAYLLHYAGVRFTHHVGELLKLETDESIYHEWIQLPSGEIIDYRARMWFGASAPHGIFKSNPGYLYRPLGKKRQVISDLVFKILTGDI